MIRFEDVSRRYGAVLALDRVSFSVAPGEVVGLLGPNGAGKTTALRILATLMRADSGRILLDGNDVARDPIAVRRRLGYQTGDTGLYSRLTPVEFLRYFGQLNDLPTTRLESRIGQLVDELGMGEFRDRLCGNLSTGQRQRTSLARALLHEPAALVLDEPTNGLDILSSRFVVSTLRRAAAEGRAVLLSTHIMSEAELVCDRVVVLHRGRVLCEGTVPDLLRRTGEALLSLAFLALIEQADGARASSRGAGDPASSFETAR